MQGTQLTTLTGMILSLEFVAFGWRVNREINVADRSRKIWVPLPDLLNIVALLFVVCFCIVVPLAEGDYNVWSRMVLAAAGVLIAFHPLTMAAHYGLPYRKQRPKRKDGDFQYAPVEEIVMFGISVGCASLAAWLIRG
jgi:hypothetical protein